MFVIDKVAVSSNPGRRWAIARRGRTRRLRAKYRSTLIVDPVTLATPALLWPRLVALQAQTGLHIGPRALLRLSRLAARYAAYGRRSAKEWQ